ncbi:MAG: hypothetical protein ACMG6S_03880 [Byssovorax sp.]
MTPKAIQLPELRRSEFDGATLFSLLKRYSSIWDTRVAPETRRRVAAEIFEPEGHYTDPQVGPLSPMALCDHVEQFAALCPGYRTEPTSGVDAYCRSLRFSWRIVDADGRPAEFPGSSGLDFVRVSERGLLQEVVGFFGELAKSP